MIEEEQEENEKEEKEIKKKKRRIMKKEQGLCLGENFSAALKIKKEENDKEEDE